MLVLKQGCVAMQNCLRSSCIAKNPLILLQIYAMKAIKVQLTKIRPQDAQLLMQATAQNKAFWSAGD
eukprot:scaffold10700_cov16-Prasinocladus_malaysianus.AAC.3